MSKRALRRFHSRRMKAKAKRVYPDWERAWKWADHLKGCSCHMCCNPRHSFYVKGDDRNTKQENRSKVRFDEQVRGLHDEKPGV